MSLGTSLSSARRKAGLSQEEVAEKLGISRQTVSKWETDETIPDILQAKKLAAIYRLSLDEMFNFDIEIKGIEEAIDKTSDELTQKVDWTKMWSRKYPVLSSYQEKVDIAPYSSKLKELLSALKKDYGYSDVDALLVLKDILAHSWKN